MPVKSWNPGDVVTASDLNVWTVPIAIIKPSNTARNTTTTLADDPDLIVPVAASTTYQVSGVIWYTGNATSADIKFTWTVPASATGNVFVAHQNLSGNFTGSFANNWNDTQTANTTTTTAPGDCLGINGILAVAGTAGNLTFRWAQNTSNGTNTTVLAQSFLVAQRIN